MKIIEIRGKEFELVTNKTLSHVDFENGFGVNLCDAYSKPSRRKKDIYYNWLNWHALIPADYQRKQYNHFGINSFNKNVFTLKMVVWYCNHKFGILITPMHNYITELA